MSDEGSATMVEAAPAERSLAWRPKGFGPWPQRPRGLPSIVEYTGKAAPSNEYPARIVSPLPAAPSAW